MGNYSFLFVDDDPLFLDVIHYLVDEAFPGARVTALSDATPVAEACARDSFDCVVLDHNMPGMSGFDCAKLLRQAFPYLPIILNTGAGDEMLAANAMKSGVTDYIPKSHLSARSLRRVVEHAMEATSQKRTIDAQREDLETFAFALAHDIKQPLRQITTFTDLLATETEQVQTPDAAMFLRFISSASSRLTDLVDVMLQYALLNQPVGFESVDVAALAEDVRLSLTDYIGERGGQVEIQSGCRIIGNKALLAQILQNLIVNGLKYNRSQSPSITIRSEADSSHCQITVQDNGIGIEEEYLSEIFKPLRRLHTADQFKGTGLGLAVVRKAVTAQKGSIWCRSEPGEGSAFIMRLPRATDGERRTAA